LIEFLAKLFDREYILIVHTPYHAANLKFVKVLSKIYSKSN